MTQEQMAARYRFETGNDYRRSSFQKWLQAIEHRRTRPRYDQVLPWRVLGEHSMEYDARMLRLVGRREAGQPLSAADALRLAGWERDLRARDAVVHYDPDTIDGFHWIARMPSDDVYIRRPETEESAPPPRG